MDTEDDGLRRVLGFHQLSIEVVLVIQIARKMCRFSGQVTPLEKCDSLSEASILWLSAAVGQ